MQAINPHILQYVEFVESGSFAVCEEQKLLAAYIRRCFETEELFVNEVQLEKYLRLARYFPYEYIFNWETFCLALHCCTYRVSDGRPRWPDLFLLLGRGAGKDGYIALESFCLISPFNNILRYNVDICANNEDQAKPPFDDVHSVLEDTKYTKKLQRHFYWNKEEITSAKTKSVLKYRTNNPKGKDGLRSGIVIFNEIHQYQDYANINVFTTGLGKKKHPRRTYATTNGDVRDGPLDDMLARSLQILNGEIPDNGMLPFICRLDKREEVDDPKMWDKANPSLRYLPDLQVEIRKEYEDWKVDPSKFTAFMTKRMNIPDGNKDIEVTSWDNILATNRPIPDLEGMTCVAGIDYMKVTDFASAGLWFRQGDFRYWITHSWVCLQSNDLPRIKYPVKEAAAEGLLTLVDDVEINPELIAEWLYTMGSRYNITKIALDNFRYALLANSLKRIGFSAKEHKNVKIVRPSDLMMVAPVIDSLFAKQQIIWGDNSLMRWYTNNTKLISSGLNKDMGNMSYGKIEPKSRKTDGFMAMAAAATLDGELDGNTGDIPDVGVYTY